MDKDYDRKFEEMKKYIPFLENMIKRLESTGSKTENPRQAQLAKIRSLRDLLLDKKKRMKMENLVKCEQVLVNLYSKVEQRESFSDMKNDNIDTSQTVQLNFVRNKLKNVTTHLQDVETLPETARCSNTEVCTASRKEPALFQRRPNNASSTSPNSSLPNKDSTSVLTRRSYTRVLVSPERDIQNWPQDISSNKPLFSRRSRWASPNHSTQICSPPNNKKDGNESSDQSQKSSQLRDLNITLKVPEESLNSLNTKDILSRIINCSDSDVDIDTLRGLRTQILSELKQTGAKDEVSDLLLTSYQCKELIGNEEIEEGELTDSEGEVFESVCGSLVIVNKNHDNVISPIKSDARVQQPRKIQICLVINSEKESQNQTDTTRNISSQNIDESDFESIQQKSTQEINVETQFPEVEQDKKYQEYISKNLENLKTNIQLFSGKFEYTNEIADSESQSPEVFSPKFYKPVSNQDSCNKIPYTTSIMSSPILLPIKTDENTEIELKENLTKQKDLVEIPLLDLEETVKREVVQEIDILKALKKEILSEKISIPDSETVTPPLHQPKVTKVANMQGMLTKKRISLEKYKEKSTTASRSSLFTNDININASKDELLKKQSLKLTDKEYERFNLSTKLTVDGSSDEEITGKINLNIKGIFGDLAPKSPDHEDFADTGIKPPVIIPADRIKTTIIGSESDVDMRLIPHVSTQKLESDTSSPTLKFEKTFDVTKNEIESNMIVNEKRLPLSDPRVRRDVNHPNAENSIIRSVDRPSRPHINFPPNMTPNRMANLTPNRISAINNVVSNVAPNLSANSSVYEMTPPPQTFECDNFSNQSHVYAPIFPVLETHDPNDSVSNEGQNSDFFLRIRDDIRNNTGQNQLYGENSHMFNRLECPKTPSHPFGIPECPPTPNHSFGRLEMPLTPIHTFGRSEAPMTPVHPFGRVDCPITPNLPFGRTEVLMTPTHPFGRNEFSQNQLTSQIPPIRYNNFQGPSPRMNENVCANYKERNSSSFNTRNYNYEQSNRHYTDSYRNFGRNQNVGRSDKNTSYKQIDSRYGERSYHRDRHYSNDRNTGYRPRDYRYENDNAKNYNDSSYSRRNYKQEPNTGRNLQDNRCTEKMNEIDSNSDNILSVQSHAGRSFIIDTSVNNSFQSKSDNLKETSVSDSNFDARRRRASSVGRSLVRDRYSTGATAEIPEIAKSSNSSDVKRSRKFRRACSAGREIAEYTAAEKNFKDIKEELQSYKHTQDEKSKNVSSGYGSTTDIRKKINDRDPRLSRRDHYDMQHNKSEELSSDSNSQRGCNRNPRFRREFHKDPQNFETKTKRHGIVYSSDNIANGTILGSGYGVKNYKIPKIKRAPEEIGSQEVVDKSKTSPNQTIDNNCVKKIEDENKQLNTLKQKQDKLDDEINPEGENKIINDEGEDKLREEKLPTKSECFDNVNNCKIENENVTPNVPDIVEGRVTRSQRNTLNEIIVLNSECPKKKVIKTKKSILYDSDSDNMCKNTNKNSPDSKKINTDKIRVDEEKNCPFLNNKNMSCNLNKEQIPDVAIDKTVIEVKDEPTNTISIFNNGLDMEPEMFSVNVATDPVIDNINPLKVDLDADLQTSKNDDFENQFTKEISLENMLDNITCVNKKVSGNTDNYREKLSEAVVINSSEISKKLIHENFPDKAEKNNVSVNNVGLKNNNNNSSEQYADLKNELNSEVSTTVNAISISHTETTPLKQKVDHIELCSTPDSTIDVNEQSQEKGSLEGVAADSTNELTGEINTDISSTCASYQVKDNAAISLLHTDSSHQADSIGSLLSILKDKSKIKELLTMLKDQSSENDRLKKKLEKLSEIVSDDEDLPNAESNCLHQVSHLSNNHNEDIIQRKMSTEQPMPANKHNEDNVDAVQSNHETEMLFNLQGQKDEQNIKEETMIDGKTNVEDLQQTTEINDKIDNNKKITETLNNIIENEHVEISEKSSVKNKKSAKKGKRKVKRSNVVIKRLIRPESANVNIEKPPTVKKPSRELKQLQDDIKEMFLHDDVFNSTGIRMCRLAKFVEEKKSLTEKNETQNAENGPAVLEKNKESSRETVSKSKMFKKKHCLKSKLQQKETPAYTETKTITEKILAEPKIPTQCRPGPKSKTKMPRKQVNVDPYMFESDSVSESNCKNSERKFQSSSESESDSLESSKSFGSSEHMIEPKKKPKRKRRGWQDGVIQSKHKKKKVEINNSAPKTILESSLPDVNCYTDKTYCFSKSVSMYSCRLCSYNGKDIVQHYKKHHPHSEIPISRMSPEVATEAIEQCEEINFQAVSKLGSDKYICRFCFKEFSRKKTVLEAFFWHVVSMHTGEYKQYCSGCVNVTRCPFILDIPPPPKEPKGQLIGYICGKCNYTQISLENLKTHVINRHNDEQTEVYTINLAVMSTNILLANINTSPELEPRVLRSSRLNQSMIERNEELNVDEEMNEKKITGSATDILATSKDTTRNEIKHNKCIKLQSQINFESDKSAGETSGLNKTSNIKFEPEWGKEQYASKCKDSIDVARGANVDGIEMIGFQPSPTSDDVRDYAHFKVMYTEAGTKEYVCCINGEGHYRKALLISFKKHVQVKHQEKWDGFCFVCKLIVTPQGNHNFKDCLQHYLDKHFDNFPLMETRDDLNPNVDTNTSNKEMSSDLKSNINYFNVRPLSELISESDSQLPETTLPIIESVVSLGDSTDEASQESTLNHKEITDKQDKYRYEEAQAEVMSKKNNVVLEVMMNREKLVHIFKCAGRFCSFTTDNPEDALRHAIAHERVGGDSLNCAYCDFDSLKNAVDLVTHVFKAHGSCQFVCSMCFYRGSASQLVRAHALRLHANASSQCEILRSTITARSDAVYDILPRDVAVPYYICNQTGDAGGCSFKTYTSRKFSEHLQTKHQSDNMFLCFVCSMIFTTAVELLQHTKSHGFKLYQCTWCVHGADSEAELLAHASERHPNKQPQAYLRIITNKEGNNYRVLPLAHLKDSNITTIDVTPSRIKGYPEREAERSIDLENLIGKTAQMIDSIVTSDQIENDDDYTEKDGSIAMFSPEPIGQSQEELVIALESSLIEQTQEEPALEVSPTASSASVARAETPNTKSQMLQAKVHKRVTPSPNAEPQQATTTPEKPNSDVIYCLDSDEEPSNQMDVSLKESPALENNNESNKPKKQMPLLKLFRCGICPFQILKNVVGFKRHVAACHPQQVPRLPCAYCPFVGHRDDVVHHYKSDHSIKIETTRYICGVCKNKYVSFPYVKKHLKEEHKSAKLCVTSKLVSNGEQQYIVGEAVKNKRILKRKPTNENEHKNLQPPDKLRKFGPDDINQLPINPILDELVFCDLCEFSTKVRLNMVRHLQLHAEQQPVPQTAPVNPVPHLETNQKHFDKMVNLASSSIVSRLDKSHKIDQQIVVNSFIPPETASRYPKYVSDRQRYTCGAKGCCYISVDEVMLKYHWETLHSGANNFHCVHCPPYQHLDTSKPLTASRIVAHLKMHDIRLYACSACSYYHHRRQVVDKHIAELHTTGNVMVVREDFDSPAPNVNQPPIATPTMDLKAWQCGLCKFKSMLRPEVVEHCAKTHHSKMQYKCTYCAFRTSTLDNITKHQSMSHTGEVQDTFYFYYREGTIPDEPDGTPRWQRQRQKSAVMETQVKIEVMESTESESTRDSPPPHPIPVVDMNIVKQDPDALPNPIRTLQELCNTFGRFCEPNGLKYKCPLCDNVSEDTREAMQSHLYEELQYRKWGCGFCPYKAFHKNGLNEHMLTEHRQNREPIELPVNSQLEAWISKALDHQFLLIEKNRYHLAEQKNLKTPDPAPSTSKTQVNPRSDSKTATKHTVEDLENLFGKFGTPDAMNFNCPKCNVKIKDENAMRNHLEIELNKIRWCCNTCSAKFQNYHEAQFHCKTAHTSCGARAVEAVRDIGIRSAWVSSALKSQKLNMPVTDITDTDEVLENSPSTDNSLLVVRYEEELLTPGVQCLSMTPIAIESDEDEEKLVIDEPSKALAKQCPFCLKNPPLFKDFREFKEHLSIHSNIKPYFCSYCDFNSYRRTVLKHLSVKHKNMPMLLVTKIQRCLGPPLNTPYQPRVVLMDDDSSKLICLRCEKSFMESESKNHVHENATPSFAKKGQLVVKCCLCLTLHENILAVTAHHEVAHPKQSLNYAYYKLHYNRRSFFCCEYCEQHFKYWVDLKAHWKAIHSSLPLKFNKRQFNGATPDAIAHLSEEDETRVKRKNESSLEAKTVRRCARKSTTKLPVQAVAKKSTTKLPFFALSESDNEEYSFYGSKPQVDDLKNVKTSMSFGTAAVSFSYKQLSEVIQLKPTVLVADINK